MVVIDRRADHDRQRLRRRGTAPGILYRHAEIECAAVAAAGVPLITPVLAFRVSPAGSAPALTVQLLYGAVPFAAVN